MNKYPDLDQWLSVAIDAARLGAAQLEEWRPKFKVREKGRADLVTDADTASQQVIKERLLGAFPDHIFVGEEEMVGKTHDETRPAIDAPPCWVVDPLDGTVNYVHDIPMYCVAIGLWYQGEAVVGVTYDPRMDEMFTASIGQGAFLNGERIRVSDAAALEDALISTGFPADLKKQQRNLSAWDKVTHHCQALRRTGSTALNLAYIAAGRFDGYWAYDNYAWDVLSGVCLVREAGGTVESITGGPHDPFANDILATNGRFQKELAKVLGSE